MMGKFLIRNGRTYIAKISGDDILVYSDPVEINSAFSMINKIDNSESKFHPIDASYEELLIPVDPEKILCPALNYAKHSQETGQKRPDFPYFFSKFRNSLNTMHGNIERYREDKLDYEGEICAIIGKKTKFCSIREAEESIGAYAVVNDVSERSEQDKFSESLGKNWIPAKTRDGYLPISNTFSTEPEERFRIETFVNGEKRQDSIDEEMIFSFPEMISYISKFMTLYPGDMILSGTPSGVAKSGKFPYLKNGDVIEVKSEKIGLLRNRVVDASSER
ncbi:fumarylacetoacetate hydrolase family protein [Caldiplasma sukawensis]